MHVHACYRALLRLTHARGHAHSFPAQLSTACHLLRPRASSVPLTSARRTSTPALAAGKLEVMLRNAGVL